MPSLLRAVAAPILAAFLLPAGAAAQMLPPSPGTVVARDSGAVMERLADGVYAITHSPATEEWPHGNTGVIVGADAVLVIDSNYLPARAVDDLALIRRVTQLPIRYLLNTHWHGDHTHGNGVYRDSFPDLQILGPRESAGFIDLNLTKLPRGMLAPNSRNRQVLAQLTSRLEQGRDSAGRPLSEEDRTTLRRNIEQRQHELREIAKVKVAPPTLVFEGAMTLDLGNRVVEIRNMGRANSPADVIAYLPRERILFAGDILVYPVPYTTLVFPMAWMHVLKQLEQYPVSALVPGHGQVMADHQYTTRVRELFETIAFKLDSLYRRGYTIPAIADSVDVSGLREKFWVPAGRPVREAFWRDWTRQLSQQFAECIMGYRC